MFHLAWYFFCKCVREFGKVWAFARAEFGMGGTGICPSLIKVSITHKRFVFQECIGMLFSMYI